MTRRSHFASLVLAAALCGAPALAAGAPPAFVSDKSRDYFGYFLPTAQIKVGNWQLKDFFIGGKDDFKSFESHKSDPAFAAVMIEFEDVTSPKKTAEDGQEYHTGQIRVLPTRYSVAGGKVGFTGTDKRLGAISFQGILDKDFFKKPAPDVPHPDDRPMLRGTLTVGGKTYSVAFNWFGGD